MAVLILDKIDQIKQDSNYDPNEFFYRLLCKEGKLKRGIQLSVWLVSNELLDVDLRLVRASKAQWAARRCSFRRIHIPISCVSSGCVYKWPFATEHSPSRCSNTASDLLLTAGETCGKL